MNKIPIEGVPTPGEVAAGEYVAALGGIQEAEKQIAALNETLKTLRARRDVACEKLVRSARDSGSKVYPVRGGVEALVVTSSMVELLPLYRLVRH